MRHCPRVKPGQHLAECHHGRVGSAQRTLPESPRDLMTVERHIAGAVQYNDVTDASYERRSCVVSLGSMKPSARITAWSPPSTLILALTPRGPTRDIPRHLRGEERATSRFSLREVS